MKHRTGFAAPAMTAVALLTPITGACAAAVAGLLTAANATAETIAVDAGIAVKPAGIPTPTRGMTMAQVTARFGAPTTKLPAVGKPPISRWEYAGFVVYFEFDHVVHTVVAS
jgi:hypothetical protein